MIDFQLAKSVAIGILLAAGPLVLAAIAVSAALSDDFLLPGTQGKVGVLIILLALLVRLELFVPGGIVSPALTLLRSIFDKQ
jgi:hypothetical protein